MEVLDKNEMAAWRLISKLLVRGRVVYVMKKSSLSGRALMKEIPEMFGRLQE